MNCRHCLMIFSLFCLLFAVVCQGCRCDTLSQRPLSSTSHGSDSLPSTESRVDAIKGEILNKLGMDRVPDVDRLQPNASAETQRIIGLYEETYRELSAKTHNMTTETEEQAKQFYSFNAARNYGVVPKRFQRRRNSVYVYFHVEINRRKNEAHELHVTEATLRLFKNRIQPKHLRHSGRKEKDIRVNVYQLIHINGGGSGSSRGGSLSRKSDENREKRRSGRDDRNERGYRSSNSTASLESGSSRTVRRRNGRRFHRRLLQTRTVSLRTLGIWEEFDILEAARDWTSDPSSNHGLLITTDSTDHKLRNVFGFRRKANSSETGARSRKTPAMNVFVRERLKAVRLRRSMEGQIDCKVGDGERRCCRFSLWISFADLGWGDWILAPDGYLAHFCDGTCPPRYKLANRFSDIKTLVNARNPAAAPAACCSATRMSPLPIAHYNQFGQVVISVFDDMIVEECKCT